jgi:hypothetical protein
MSRHYLMKKIIVRKKIYNSETWESVGNAIEIKESTNFRVTKASGRRKDSFDFKANNAKNKLFETFHSGDGIITAFTLEFSPIPSSYLGTVKFEVYVDDVLLAYDATPVAGEYSVSGSTLTFGGAPASGSDNIRVVFQVIEPDDLVRIYRWADAASETNADILEEGFVIATSANIKTAARMISIRGRGLMSLLFEGLAFTRLDGDNKAHLYIQDIIAQVNEFNLNGASKRIIYGESPAEWTALSNSLGVVDKSYNRSYRTAIELIDELSSSELTGGGQYIFYVLYDASNDRYNFYWKAKGTTSSGNLSEGSEPFQIKTKLDADEIINTAIYNCGISPGGDAIEQLYYDTGTVSGAKWKYITKTNNLGTFLINKEFNADQTKWDTSTVGTTEVRISTYPASGSIATYGAMTFTERSLAPPYDPTGVAYNITTNEEFNAAIIIESWGLGYQIAKGVIDELNDFRAEIIFSIASGQSPSYVLGTLYTLDVPSFGVVGTKLRIEQLDHYFWNTDVVFKEDSE